jgi:hypothetical protein
MIKFITRPMVARRLAEIDAERDLVEQAIQRAKKNKRAVQPLYDHAAELQKKRMKLERWT